MRLSVVFLILLIPAIGMTESDKKLTPEQIVERSMAAIVAIRAETPEGVSSGTGFLVDPSGVIVTNLHVIEGATRAAVKLHSGEQYTQVKVASYDEGRDLAVLRIPGFDLSVLPLANSDDVKVGATVYAIGNPMGLEESVTKGIVSSVRVADNGSKIIQTDSAVSPGNSGGPLLNDAGEVIGVVTFKIRGGENINFAVPANYARALLGFETLMSLDDLRRKLGKQEASLFSDEDSTADEKRTGTWLSLSSNTKRQLTVSGDYIYGTYNNDDPAEGNISNGTYDVRRVDDNNYEGTATAKWNCWYYKWNNKIENYCTVESKMELTLVSPDRIEGRVYSRKGFSSASDKGFKKACDKCFENRPQEWIDFVWVRQD